ncbi:MAG TPA: cyanophycin synthetase [Azospirillaceae bacterium]|nr:cyanophycin synthetase [Azospirillaceae bacterium]
MTDSDTAMTPADTTPEPMRVLGKSVYRGPHIFGRTPMIRIQLLLGSLDGKRVGDFGDLGERLAEALPDLGGPVSPDIEFPELIRLLALHLQARLGTPVAQGLSRPVVGDPGAYDIVFEYRDEPVGLLAGRVALELVDSLLPDEVRGIARLDRVGPSVDQLQRRSEQRGFDLEEALEELTYQHGRQGLGPTTGSLVAEAERRGIPWTRLDAESLVQLGWGSRQKWVRASMTGNTSLLASDAASDKDLTKLLLDESGVPVPRGEVVHGPESAVDAAERLGYPVVTKPLDGNHGRGVSLDLQTPDEVRLGFKEAEAHGRCVIVEQFYKGNDHRILVVGGKVVAAAERVPAHVVGDGEHTIAQLVEEVNKDPRRGEGHEKVMTRITIDEHVRTLLHRRGMTPDSVPEAGERVYLRDTANLSTGGTSIDRTDTMHPDNRLIAERAAMAIGLDVAGIDMITPDISKSIRETGGGIVEVNAAPGFRMHLEPSEGTPRNVAGPVLDTLFPDGDAGRIPLFAITGTNGKSTTSRMLTTILRRTGLRVGTTSTTGVYVDEQLIAKWDASGPKSARMLLRDRTVEAAVLETARGGILREGLGYDAADVGIFLNVDADHLGSDGVNTIEDLARVKAVVVEAVRDTGHSVLNADDPRVVGIADRAGGTIVWISLKGSEAVRKHLDAGGMAAVREPGPQGGTLVLHRAGERIELMQAAEIPATLGGAAEFNIQNALAASAAAFAHGIDPALIRAALAGFGTSYEQSPGRMNVLDRHGFRIIVDYCHNPAALRVLGRTLEAMLPNHGKAGTGRLIGMINIPGDRRDEDMREMGSIAAGIFDEIVFREDSARRGRQPGEICALLKEGAMDAGYPEERIRCELEEDDAARTTLDLARPGDLVVLTPTSIDDIWKIAQTYEPAQPYEETGTDQAGTAADEATATRAEASMGEAPRPRARPRRSAAG